ncbi:hypothetical protein [Pendulispora albinea]|uniref:Uncharacterized protein n=1 Tax=Pendulispora albinea TaxID=2741071 RepID=A0ABZ2LJR1_9BACT
MSHESNDTKTPAQETAAPRKLTLKDLKLEIRTQEQVWGGFGSAMGGVGNQWAFGPRADSGAGDAAAWNEGDITLAEQE